MCIRDSNNSARDNYWIYLCSNPRKHEPDCPLMPVRTNIDSRRVSYECKYFLIKKNQLIFSKNGVFDLYKCQYGRARACVRSSASECVCTGFSSLSSVTHFILSRTSSSFTRISYIVLWCTTTTTMGITPFDTGLAQTILEPSSRRVRNWYNLKK